MPTLQKEQLQVVDRALNHINLPNQSKRQHTMTMHLPQPPEGLFQNAPCLLWYTRLWATLEFRAPSQSLPCFQGLQIQRDMLSARTEDQINEPDIHICHTAMQVYHLPYT